MGHRASIKVTRTTIGFKTAPRAQAESEDEVKPRTEDLISPLSALPTYSVLFKDTQTAIFAESGPLSIPTRHFIALLVRKLTYIRPLNTQS